MIRFYFHPTPNPAKVALFLEEAGLAYEVVPVDTAKGEQHLPQFRDPAVSVAIGCAHESYGHLALLSPATRAELARDFA